MNELEQAVERLRMEMLLQHPRLAENLKAIESHLLHERDATLGHIRHIAALKQETQAIIRGELEALRDVLIQAHAPTPPPIPQTQAVPEIEQRYTRPRFLSEVA
jgi:hypothetical protein